MGKAINLGRKQDLSHLATKVELEGKEDKIVVIEIQETYPDVRFNDNTIFNCTEIAETLSIRFDGVKPGELCQLNFTSGRTATELRVNTEYEYDVKWTGDDIDAQKGVFVPEVNRRYTVMLYSDGLNVRGVVSGVDYTEPIE